MTERQAYQEIVTNALAATGARMVVLTRFDPETQIAHVETWAAPGSEVLARALAAVQRIVPDFDPGRVAIKADVNRWARATYLEGQPVSAGFDEVARGTVDERVVHLASSVLGLRHAFLCPLRVRTRVAGSLAFYTAEVLTDAQRRTAEAFSRQAALTLENAWLLEAERQQRRIAQELHEAALALAAPAPAETAAVGALLATIVQCAVTALGARDGWLTVVDDPAWRDLVPGTGPAEGYIRVERTGVLRRTAWRPHGATMHVLTTGELVSEPDTLAPAPFGPYPRLVRRGVRSRATVPLWAGGWVLGALAVNYAAPGGLRDEDRQSVHLFAAHAAAALERVRLAYAERRRRASQAEDLAAALAQEGAAREEARRRLALQREELVKREAEAAALRELDRLKNELLSTISHELRTPLTVVHGYAQRLKARAHSLGVAHIQAAAASILAGSTQLTRLVEDLLDFARMERGEVRVQPADFDLVPMLQDLVGEFRRQEGGERLACEAPAALPVRADRARAAQVVANLLENAVKYAPEGPIVLRAARRTPVPRDGTGMVRVEVEDHGPGILPVEQERVWEKFFRGASVAQLHLARGTGIGLAVVKALVEAQGGRVGLESTPGRGCCFWLELPAGPATGSVGATHDGEMGATQCDDSPWPADSGVRRGPASRELVERRA